MKKKTERFKKMAETPKPPLGPETDRNAPVSPSPTTRNVGGKTIDEKTSGGTIPGYSQVNPFEGDDDKKKSDEALERVKSSLGPDKINSPSKEDSDKAAQSVQHRVIENEDGTKTIISAMTEDDAKKAEEAAKQITQFPNETMRQFGVPGLVDLTAGGTLQGDMSVKPDRDAEETSEMLEEIAAHNPIPNRIGNELTNAMNGFRVDNILAMNRSFKTTIDDILENDGNISEETRKQLEGMKENLK